MRCFFFLLFAFSGFVAAYGQVEKRCNCPETQFAGTKADAVFHLPNGKTIVLCGYTDPDIKPATYSEFVLSVCGSDTSLGFWPAVLTCRLKTRRNTLLVENLKTLPVGSKMKFEDVVWTTEEVSFEGPQVSRAVVVNRRLRKYNRAEIQTVLHSYEKAKSGLDDDSKMEIANRLFVAAISGDKRARQYFNEFKTKPRILGAHYLEEYDALVEMLQLWEK